MRIATAQIYRYDLPLRIPLHLNHQEFGIRSGLLLRIELDGDAIGWGDVAPLPGFSAETLDDTLREALRLARWMTGKRLPIAVDTLTDRLTRWLWEWGLSPSLEWGVQSAIMNALAAANDLQPHVYLGADSGAIVTINGLLDGSMEQIVAEAKQLRADGFSTVKLKVGRGPIEDNIARVRAVRAALGNDAILRLDANRSWDYDTALTFAQGVADCDIAYMEEPLRDPSRLVGFAGHSGIPVALDETLREDSVELLDRWRGVRVAVLKPTLLGGVEYNLWMARRACNLGMTPVISAAYESGVGISALAAFAAAIGEPDVAVGLDTYRRLADDVLEKPLDMTGGRLNLSLLNRVDETRLIKVTESSHV